MSTRKPNKKRNALLMFELLTLHISKSLVEKDDSKAIALSNLLKRFFANGKPLQQEYRLTKSLVESKVSSESIAANILQQARAHAMSLPKELIESAKTELLEEVHKIDPTGLIFEQNVEHYKLYSTIGTLVRDWYMGGLVDLSRISMFETAVAKHLVEGFSPDYLDTETETEKTIGSMTPGERRAMIAILGKKIEEKWGNRLSRRQTSLLRESILGDTQRLTKELADSQHHVLALIEKQIQKPGTQTDRLYETKKLIESDNDFSEVNDDLISRYMLYLDLEKEFSK
jgi:hypothetical protein